MTTTTSPDTEQDAVIRRYDRIARFYDPIDKPMNVQQLTYGNDSFDTVTATCVFCSVTDPVAGLREVARVVRSDGQVLLLEHEPKSAARTSNASTDPGRSRPLDHTKPGATTHSAPRSAA